MSQETKEKKFMLPLCWQVTSMDCRPHVPFSSPLCQFLLSTLTQLTQTNPLVIQIVGLDPLRDEGIAYATALKAAGYPQFHAPFIHDSVRTEMDVYAGIPHGFTLFPDLPAAQLGLKRAAKAIQWILQKKAIE
jgi:acetyl esterase/lipase